jgi:hypothetical protein
MKDYELEVCYHPGKVNVDVDALSLKAHSNNLPAVRSMGEESINQVLPDLSLYNITLMLTLSEIIATQKRDKGMKHIQRR